jgi:O-acetyl-ADP-ribose deacetylase (regulator of RNase III)
MPSDFVIQLGLCHLQLLKGDITTISVDAIVNAANSHLSGGGGVDGAIHLAGGPQIMHELDEIRAKIGSCPPGSAVVTGAGHLPARYVFHAVGPRYKDGTRGEAQILASCYSTCLNLAAERDIKTISFPSISTGIYGYPLEDAADVAVTTVANWLRAHTDPVRVVKLVQFTDNDHQVYLRHAQSLRRELAAGGHS